MRTMLVTFLASLAPTLSPATAQDRPLTADFPEVYRVGGLTAPDWAQFTERGDLGFDASGNLYVLDAQAFRVVVIDPVGNLVRTVGQRGEGPGDLRAPTALVVWRDGRFAVADGEHWAIQVFGADGSHDHFARMNTEFRPFQLQQLTLQRRMEPHPDGVSLYAQGAIYAHRAMASWGTHPDSVGADDRTIERFDIRADRVVAETALKGWRAPRESPREPLPDALESGDILRVFLDDLILEPKFHWDVLPDGTLAYSDSSAYVVRFVAADGAPRGELRRPFVPEAVTERMHGDLMERELDQFKRPSPAMLLEIMEEREFYPEVPIIRWLRATWEGGLWVRRRGEEPWEYGPTDVFDADRNYVGTYAPDEARIPDAFGPDGLVAYWEVDEMDVPSIVVKRVPAGVR